MKVKSTFALALLAVASGALSSCGSSAELQFWSSFGTAYTSVLNGIIEKAGQATGTTFDHNPTGSYDKVKSEMMSAIADSSYPDLVTGYPDHFAEYLGNDILQPLDKYVKAYDEANGTNLLEDYFPAYMEENYSLAVDDEGNKVLSALPFNKSTELMGYNGVFVDYCATIDPSLATVPSTWQEWEAKGPKYREILTDLAGGKKALYGVQNEEGTASQFNLQAKRIDKKDANGNYVDNDNKPLLLDFTDVDVDLTRVISWDSTDNMFITLVRQWGGQYTRLDAEQMKQEPLYRKGDILFNAKNDKQYGDVRSKVVDCMRFFKKLNKDHIFGVPKEFQQSYSSKAFELNQVMFMLCSSGGLSYNTAKWTNRFRVAPLPYNAALGNDGKYVISQGANITLTDRNQADPDKSQKAFNAMVAMTTGSLQAEWCLNTGYYPCSKSATDDPAYQAFLASTDYTFPTTVAYREGANINQKEYMDTNKGWHKFVDPAFIGSSDIRTLVKTVFESTFIKIVVNDSGEEGTYPTVDAVPDSVFEAILAGIVNDPTIKQKAQNINVVA